MNAKPTLTLEVVAHRKAMRQIALEMAAKEVFTVMPDFGHAWGWRKPGGVHPAYGVGGNCDGSAEPPISDELQEAFSDWQSELEGADWHRDNDRRLPIDWNDYHHRGLELTKRLKVELGEEVCVVYEKPMEDPDCYTDERREVLYDGGLVPLPSRRDLDILYPDTEWARISARLPSQ